MEKGNKVKVSGDAPKLGLEAGNDNEASATVVNPGAVINTDDSQKGNESEANATAVNSNVATNADATQTGDQNEANAAVEKNDEEETTWIRVLLPLAGRFLLPHDPGAEFEINKNQADIIVDAAYAEFLTPEEIELKKES